MAVSVVVPVYNEEANVVPFCEELTATLDGRCMDYEVIFVDDGSCDRTPDLLRSLCEKDACIRVVRLSRNCGQTTALQAGFEEARGEVIVTMDGDRQNDPADIPRMLALISDGYDIVTGWRKERADALITRRIPSMAANWLIRRLVGGRIHDNGCALKAYRRKILEKTRLYSDMHRFVVPVFSLAGARIKEVVVNHRPRQSGQSKYGLSRLWQVLLDLLVLKMLLRFSFHPASWFAILAFPFAVAAAGAGAASVYFGYTGSAGAELPIVALSTCLIATFAVINLVLFGMIAELVVDLGDIRETESLLFTIEKSPG